jgi:hypothetical protein
VLKKTDPRLSGRQGSGIHLYKDGISIPVFCLCVHLFSK